MQFGVLGPLRVVAGDSDEPGVVSAARLRVLLAVLLWRANQPVPVDELAEMVWDGEPPARAAEAARALIMRLRRGLGERAAARIVTRAPGYVIEVSRDELDASRFETLTWETGAAVRACRWADAARTAATALGLWRGAPLLDIPSQMLRDQWVPHIEQLRVQALEWRIEADLHDRRHEQLIPELRDLTARHPLREHFHAQLMLALVRSGRQAEALAAYQEARRALVGELGIDPGAELCQLHERILAGDASLIAPPTAPAVAAPPPAAATIPRQLPAAVRSFVGRQAEFGMLNGLAEEAAEAARAGGTAVVSAIDGMAGVGKTALAVHFAHRTAARFPDGQLYADLRGFGPSGHPVEPTQVISGFLNGLGASPQAIPDDADARAALYRSLLTGKQVLIMLDNAHNAAQVRPLLPGAPGCLVLVTSRNQLTGLAAVEGARLLTLGVLDDAEATELLAARLGAPRVAAEPDAVAELTRLCARLPLALTITAARGAACPASSLAVMAAELRGTPLDALDAGEPASNVRAVFGWSYRNLSDLAARMFRLLCLLHPGPDISLAAAASLAGIPAAESRRALRELAAASMLTEHLPSRYAFHQLLREYAVEQARATSGPGEHTAAAGRLRRYYQHPAASLLRPAIAAVPDLEITPEPFNDISQA
jgi:DNA-binding SARP family transcriptional activator